ncbi:hypothetical protein GCM10011386_47410 [Parapedobacter defluvii]|uniref:Uncharacterized protein n=2 Tax=Parapedobacter defluvii TaxID=2045106 RepID=A0ABQ1MYU0_9SPHI|nr:hypothetical protein GCM10011386_47410 [Parapedobacter defluvii]
MVMFNHVFRSRFLVLLLLSISIWACKKESATPYTDVDDPAVRQLLLTPASQRYYWHGDQKLFFNWNTEMYVVDIRGGADQLDPALASIGIEASYYRLQQDPSVARLILERSFLSALLSKLDNELEVLARYPGIRLVDQNDGISFITDEISIKFNNEMNTHDLIAFAEKYEMEYIDSTSYGNHLFRSRNRMRTLSIANFIQEHEQTVEWSSPNFVMLIQLWGTSATE